MVFAAQDQRYTHARVIHCVAEEEIGRAVGPADHEVADVIGQEALWPMNEVHERDPVPGGHPEAHRRRNSLGTLLRLLLGRQAAANAGIPRRTAGGDQGLAGNLKLQGRAEAWVNPPLPLQDLEIAGVEGRALRLPVGAALVLAIRARVPVDTQPMQIFHQSCGVGLTAALDVCILDAQDEASAGSPGQEEIEQRGAGIAQVQLSRGARGEACRLPGTERPGG